MTGVTSRRGIKVCTEEARCEVAPIEREGEVRLGGGVVVGGEEGWLFASIDMVSEGA